MKELEDKIRLILEAIDIGDSYDPKTPDYWSASEVISKEIKDIAIEFAKFKFKQEQWMFGTESRTDSELFNQFIEERYKP